MARGSLSLANQVSFLAFLALLVIAVLGWLDIRDKRHIGRTLETQERLLIFKQYLSSVERDLLSARIEEISMIQTREPATMKNFQAKIDSAQTLSSKLIVRVENETSLSRSLVDGLKITLTEDLSQYEKSVQSLAEIEMRIGLQAGQGLLGQIETYRTKLVRLIESVGRDSLSLSFSKIQLSEQEFSRTLDMRISDRLVSDIDVFRRGIELSDIDSNVQTSLLENLDIYANLVAELLESTLELELAIALNSLNFYRITPELEKSQSSLDKTLSLIERTLVQRRQNSTLQTAILFSGTFLIILSFVIIQVRNNQHLVMRLKRLADGMGKVASGNYPHQHELPEGNDEVGVLSQAFTSMASQIHEQINTIEEERRKAEVANQAKSVFLANMSHELRTPLNAILGFTQIMQHEPAINPAFQRYLGIINDSGEHLLSLINDVLEISKIESGKFTLNLLSFDLDRLLDMLQRLLQTKAESKQLAFALSRSPEVPRYIRTDEGKLRQILINLLGNAIKFTESGMVSLTVLLDSSLEQPVPSGQVDNDAHMSHGSDVPTTIGTSPPQTTLRFVVKDTGPGIAQEEVEQIFDSFAQTRLGQTSYEGSGLGLSISRQFARFIGGDITVASTVGCGSAFTLTLTVECIDEWQREDANAVYTPTRQIQTLALDERTPRILVAEDQRGNRLLMRKLLETIGFAVEEALNGQCAVDKWQEWQPDLILMDIQMPVMDGLEAISQIRHHRYLKQPKIIALTASAFEEQRQAILSAGFDDFASKPVQREQLLTMIGTHLGIRYRYKVPVRLVTSSPGFQNSPTSLNLDVMPRHWIQQLYHTAIRGDDFGVHELIQQIPPDQPDLIAALTEWTENYRFDLLVELSTSAQELQV